MMDLQIEFKRKSKKTHQHFFSINQYRIGLMTTLLLLLMGVNLDAQQAKPQQNPDRLQYIERFKSIAISEMQRAGVPASIKLAQGILESNAGKSTLARKANNHFGMKCGSVWKGKTHYREDDDYNDQGKLIESCFRAYENADQSYVAHSEFLRDPRKNYRYGFLFNIEVTDYERWALGLKKAGYATNPRYPDLLIGIIETYELYIYDNMTNIDTGPTEDELSETEFIDNTIKINTARVAIAKEGETPEDIAVRTFSSVKNILKYNEQLAGANQVLGEDYKVYLQPKRNSYRGKSKYHYVKNNESMFDISQMYGIKLNRLYKRNRLAMGREPSNTSRIKLRGWKVPKEEAVKSRRKGEKVEKLETLPMQDMKQDPELEFDKENATSIEDFEVPNSGDRPNTIPSTNTNTNQPPTTNNGNTNNDSAIPDDLRNPTGNNTQPPTGNNNPTSTGSTGTQPPNTGGGYTPPVDNAVLDYHIVQDGDTLYRLAKKYELTVPALKAMNGLATNVITIGQRLKIK